MWFTCINNMELVSNVPETVPVCNWCDKHCSHTSDYALGWPSVYYQRNSGAESGNHRHHKPCCLSLVLYWYIFWLAPLVKTCLWLGAMNGWLIVNPTSLLKFWWGVSHNFTLQQTPSHKHDYTGGQPSKHISMMDKWWATKTVMANHLTRPTIPLKVHTGTTMSIF